MIACLKDGLRVNYRSTDGAGLLRNLQHRLEDDAEVKALPAKLPGIRREAICGC